MRLLMQLLMALIIFCFGFTAADAATMDDYCVQPPFVSTTVKPNVLVVMDFSGSMQFPTYLTCSFSGYSGQTAAYCGTTTGGYNYDSAINYYGYFDHAKCYAESSNRFQETADATCLADKIGNSASVSGNLLNWITTTRVDAARKVLTGGRINMAGHLESEGAIYTYNDPNLKCTFAITAGQPSNRAITISNYSGGPCPLGNSAVAGVEVKISGASTPTGVLDETADKLHYEFMVFAANKRDGEMRSGKDATLSSLKGGINNEPPYDGTTTGEGLWEAYDFFKQENTIGYEANTAYLNKGNSIKDPYYDGSGGGSIAVPCRKGFVLLLSDGAWNGNVDPAIPARVMRTTDLRDDLSGTQNIITYAVYAFGDSDPGTGLQGNRAMRAISMFGSFDDKDGNNYPYPFTGISTPGGTCNSAEATPKSNITDSLGNTHCNSRLITTFDASNLLSVCNPSGTYNNGCKEWDKNGNGIPETFFFASNPDELRQKILDAIYDILRRAASGTAVSVLASGEGSGANMLQAFFYPKKTLGTSEIEWIGEMQNLWYYIDPWLESSNIFEDTTSDKKLNIGNDDVIHFYFDPADNKTKAQRYTGGGAYIDTVQLEDIKNLWEAGSLLFSRDLGTSPRTIYTTINGSSILAGGFSTANKTALRPYLDVATDTEAEKVINYVHGIDQSGYRSRTATIGGSTNVWKLGDIVSSTPRIQSSIRLSTYHTASPQGYGDTTYRDFINSAPYKTRGMVYAGANDGMLHAFKLGELQMTWAGQGANEKAKLGGSDLGKEQWAYVPKNTLPYLKYMADTGYCHLYYVDAPSYIFDASIGGGSNSVRTQSDWRTIVIGGMGLGGACRKTGTACTDCVKTPILDPSDGTKGLGYSSYFAVNVTDPASPQLLWEFSHEQLGYSFTGPVIIRIGDPIGDPLNTKNGAWFAVFGSGPTGPIDAAYRQFMGRSDQTLKLFIVDLRSGSYIVKDTGITDAFAGSLFNSSIDTDRATGATGKYSDDVFYVGYVKKSGTTWTDGGVLRVITKEDSNPANWAISTVIDGIGPVTTSVTRLQDTINKKLWLYFGTGRFFYKGGELDDAGSVRKIFGVKEPCYNSSNDIDNGCSSALTLGSLADRTALGTTEPAVGWYINLDAAGVSSAAERVITDPLALPSGAVFFTTFAPSADVCSLGGSTYLWVVKYNTGGGAANSLKGEALMQVGTGEIKEVALSTAFTGKEGRRTAAITGMPPRGQGLTVVTDPQPIRKVLHIQEKR